MIHALYSLYQHIINIYFDGAPDQILEDFVDHSLERDPSIHESKMNYLVVVDSPTGTEGDFISSDRCILFDCSQNKCT